MTYRTAEGIVTWALLATAACRSDRATSPGTPTCSSALATPVVLAVGAYLSIDPASDAGCITFPSNASAVDSAEYLLVPQSAAGTFGQASPFALREATVAATAAPVVQRPLAPSAAVQFDGFLRRLGRARAAPARAAASRLVAQGAPSLAAPVPPTPGSLRTFAVCSALDCSKFKSVGARARAVGAHVAIYVDTLAPANGLDSADIDTLRQVFDG